VAKSASVAAAQPAQRPRLPFSRALRRRRNESVAVKRKRLYIRP
jgi:hypothetical protein